MVQEAIDKAYTIRRRQRRNAVRQDAIRCLQCSVLRVEAVLQGGQSNRLLPDRETGEVGQMRNKLEKVRKLDMISGLTIFDQGRKAFNLPGPRTEVPCSRIWASHPSAVDLPTRRWYSPWSRCSCSQSSCCRFAKG